MPKIVSTDWLLDKLENLCREELHCLYIHMEGCPLDCPIFQAWESVSGEPLQCKILTEEDLAERFIEISQRNERGK